MWCKEYILSRSSYNVDFSRVVIRYDSEYAAKSVLGIFNGKKNVELITAVRRQYAELRRIFAVGEVDFVHVKGHSSARWNDRADELAGFGAAGRVCSEGRYGSNEKSIAYGSTANNCSSSSNSDSCSSNGSGSGNRTLINEERKTGPILGAQNKRKFHQLSESRFADSRFSGFAVGVADTKKPAAIKESTSLNKSTCATGGNTHSYSTFSGSGKDKEDAICLSPVDSEEYDSECEATEEWVL